MLAQELLDLKKVKELSEYERKLKELTLFMGEVFKDQEARKELFELAKADDHKDDISYSLKKLIATNENPVSRKRSAIVNAFYQNAERYRTNGEKFEIRDLVDFINKHEIRMLAPYMVGYFEPETITELTVSWWTEEMETEALKIDPDWKGETPGFKLKLNDEGNFVIFGAGNDRRGSDLIYANDDYAVKNPTIVFGSFKDEEEFEKTSKKMSGVENLAINSAKIRCSDYHEGMRYTLSMPEYRLTSNVAGWPRGNFVHLWVIFGDITNLPINTPPTSLNINMPKPMAGVKVTRSEANNGTWRGGPILVPNLPFESNNFSLVWSVERNSHSFQISGRVTVSKKGVSIP